MMRDLKCTKQMHAQQGFSRLYGTNLPFATFSSIEAKGEHYYVTGRTAEIDTPQYLKGLFGKLDSDGDLISINDVVDTIAHPFFLYWNTLKKTNDGNFVAVGEKWDSLYKIFMVKMDTMGNVLLLKEYSYPQVNIFQAHDVVEVPGSGYLIVINANLATNGNSIAIVFRTDTLGNLLNTAIHDLSATEFPWVVKPMQNGNYMLGGVTRKTNTNTPFWTKTWLLEVDSMGNYVNQWIDTDNKNKWPYGMQQTADSGWIIVRQHLAYDQGGLQLYNASVIKLDKDFTKEWEIIRGDSGFDTGLYDVEILPDGKYIVCGTTPEWGTDSAHHFGWILKIDTDGTILWERKYVAYERFGTYSFLYDIDVLPNGDLLACGELRFTFNVGITPIQQGWILRTDSNGCVIENCLTGIDIRPETTDEREILLWPNPASNFIEVVIESDMEMADIHIYNLTGALVLEQKANRHNNRIDVSQLSKGMYVVSAEKQGRFLKAKLVIE